MWWSLVCQSCRFSGMEVVFLRYCVGFLPVVNLYQYYHVVGLTEFFLISLCLSDTFEDFDTSVAGQASS